MKLRRRTGKNEEDAKTHSKIIWAAALVPRQMNE
jgi:hypothetical protein